MKTHQRKAGPDRRRSAGRALRPGDPPRTAAPASSRISKSSPSPLPMAAQRRRRRRTIDVLSPPWRMANLIRTAPANTGIVDLRNAPRGADGRVAYSTDVVILRPVHAADAKRVCSMMSSIAATGLPPLSSAAARSPARRRRPPPSPRCCATASPSSGAAGRETCRRPVIQASPQPRLSARYPRRAWQERRSDHRDEPRGIHPGLCRRRGQHHSALLSAADPRTALPSPSPRGNPGSPITASPIPATRATPRPPSRLLTGIMRRRRTGRPPSSSPRPPASRGREARWSPDAGTSTASSIVRATRG